VRVSTAHKVHIYKKYLSVCPHVEIATPPPSIPQPEPGGGGHTHLRVRVWGSPNSDDWRKSLALCRLCATAEPLPVHSQGIHPLHDFRLRGRAELIEAGLSKETDDLASFSLLVLTCVNSTYCTLH
jgi:hypothetical protein